MNLLAKIKSGVSWGLFSVIIMTIFQILFMAVMARLLDPVDFGVIAIANVSLRFYSYFSQVGIAPALIQRKTLQDGDVNAALSLSLGVSSLFFLVAYFASPFTEAYFKISGLSLIMQVLAVNFVILGFSSINLSLLRRESRFKAISTIEIISYFFGYGATGLTAAYLGAGVWALVAAFMTQSIFTALLTYKILGYPIKFSHSKEQRKSLMSYGIRYSIIGFVEFLTANLVPLIIGKILGAVPAGVFNRAQLLAQLPIQQPANVLSKTLFPIMSKMNDEHGKQLISLQLSSLIVGCYACAVGISIHTFAFDIVSVLLGDKWLNAVPVLETLSLSIAPYFIAHSAGVTLDTMAKLKLKLRIQLTVLLLMIIQLLLLAPILTIEIITYVVLSTGFIRLILMYGSVTYVLNMTKKELALIIMTFFCVTCITGTFTYVTSILVVSINIPVLRLIIDMFAGGIGFVASIFFVRCFINRLHSIVYLKQQFPIFNKIMEI